MSVKSQFVPCKSGANSPYFYRQWKVIMPYR